jgi:hypothetical protein
LTTRYAVRYIGGPIGRQMRRWGWAGVTLPVPFFGSIVLMWGQEANLGELRHEVLGHVPQIARMGTAWYLTRILYEYIRYGHRNAPMEIEARRLTEAAHQQQETTS